jgi:hypothetical protein
MAQITIGEGLWSTIRGYLNTMFAELYASVGSGVGNANSYSQTIDLTAGDYTRIVTTLTSKPKHITIWDDTGKVVGPNTIPDIQRSLVGGVYVFDIYCSDELENLELEINY